MLAGPVPPPAGHTPPGSSDATVRHPAPGGHRSPAATARCKRLGETGKALCHSGSPKKVAQIPTAATAMPPFRALLKN